MQITDHGPFQLLLKASWQAAVLILLVLVAQKLFGKRLSPRWRYSLWLLVIVRLALPWTVPSSASLFNILNLPGYHFAATPRAAAVAESPVGASATTLAAVPAGQTFAFKWPGRQTLSTSSFWLLTGWLGGAALLTGYLFVTHWRFSRNVAARRPITNSSVLNLLEDCKQQMDVRAPVTLIETDNVGSPALFGFIRPRLLLPVGLIQNFSLTELRYIFLHELGHIKRRDILFGWLFAALQIAHWFNPLVWLAFYRMRVDREFACDALALSRVNDGENQAYGQTIIKLLESFGRSAWAPSLAGTVEDRNQIKERIRMIAKFKKTNHGLALAAALFAALGIMTLTDARPAAAELSKELLGDWILVGSPDSAGIAPAAGGRVMSVKDGKFEINQTDPKTGSVIFHHGGTWTLEGNEYTEKLEFANESSQEVKGKTFKFDVKIEGDKLSKIGKGNDWKEVWMRVPTFRPKKSDAAALQGEWTGQEVGGESSAPSSLVIKDSTLEFHGGNPNEWYKGTITVYETTPRQLILSIEDCPIPQYRGQSGYAIYELKDGKLTITGNEPGTPTVPANFDAVGARKIVFSRK
jgi:beta-lactamase regulating signal transducer with metallopeptidase domain